MKKTNYCLLLILFSSVLISQALFSQPGFENIIRNAQKGPNAGIQVTGFQCNGIPVAGLTLSSVNPVCPSMLFTLSLSEPYSPDYSYTWQISEDNQYWGTYGTSYPNPEKLVISQDQDLYYRCKITCINSGLSSYSVPVRVNLRNGYAPVDCPCSSSAYESNDYSDITGIEIAGLNNISDCMSSPGGYSIKNQYSDYTSLAPGQLPRNTALPVNISITACQNNTNSQNKSMVKVFIDLNKNGSFSDAGENLFTSALFYSGMQGTVTLIQGTINIPAQTESGVTRMRVISLWSGQFPCENYFNGETEDYLINIVPGTPCTGAVQPGLTISAADSLCQNSAFSVTYQHPAPFSGISKQWQSSPDSLIWTDVSGATNDVYSTTLSSTTFYRCKFTCTFSGNISYSLPKKITKKPHYLCYTYPDLGAGGQQTTIHVKFGSLDNFSGCNTQLPSPSVYPKYSDYRLIVPAPDILQGSSVPIYVTAKNCSNQSSYTTMFVLIDFNQNGLFDSNEEIIVGAGDVSTPSGLTKSRLVPVPQDAPLGLTGMRIMYSNNSNSEIEDYLVNIVGFNPCTGIPVPGRTLAEKTILESSETYTTLSLENDLSSGGLNFMWEYSVNGTSWNNFSITTGPTLQVSADWYFKCKVTCTHSGLFAYSTPVKIIRYCNAYASSPDNAEIYNVTVANLNNSSSCSTQLAAPSVYRSYSNYRNSVAPADLPAGSTINFSLTAGTCGSTSAGFLRIYIDFNKNGSFADAGETVYTSAVFNPSAAGVIRNGSFIVPASSLPGLTGMRVMFIQSNSPASFNSCSSYTYGETEDYLVNIQPSTPCSGTPDPGNTVFSCSKMSIQNQEPLNQPGISYQWQWSSDNLSWENIPGAIAASLNNQLVLQKYYRCAVTCAGSGLTGNSIPLQLTLDRLGNCYCIPPLINFSTDYADITRVQTGTLDNLSTCITTGGNLSVPNYYSNYRHLTATDLIQGPDIPLTVTASGCNYSDSLYQLKVYIDLDQNGSFNETNEKLLVTSAVSMASGPVTIQGNFSIPFGSLTGRTIMRVMLVNQGAAQGNSCSSYSTGESEDYTINIIAAGSCPGNYIPGQTIAAINPICPGDSLILKLQQRPIISGYTFQWEYAADNISWNVLSGQTDSVAKFIFNNPGYYRCRLTCTNGGQQLVSTPLFIGSIAPMSTVPYTEDFESMQRTGIGIVPCGWATESPSTGNWTSFQSTITANSGQQFMFLGSIPLQTWMFTKGIQLSAGITYKISFHYRTNASQKRIILATGSGQTSSQMTEILEDLMLPYSGERYQFAWTSFTPSSAGIYYFGTGIETQAPPNGVWIDDFSVTELNDCEPPTFTSARTEGTSAFISWKCTGCTGSYLVEYGPVGFTPGQQQSAGMNGTIVPSPSTEVLVTGLTPLSNYEIYVRRECAPGVYTINTGPIKFSTFLVNDICSGATLISCTNTTVTINSLQTTNDNIVSNCGSGGGLIVKNGTWFKMQGDNNTITVSTCSSTYDTKISVFKGNCASLECVTSNDNAYCYQYPYGAIMSNRSKISFNALAGTDYYILIHGTPNFANSLNVEFTCTTGFCAPPSNDEAVNATALVLATNSENYIYSNNTCATVSPVPNPPLNNGICGESVPVGCVFCPYGNSEIIQDIWFSFNSGSSTAVQLFLASAEIINSASQNYYYGIYSGSPGNLSYKSCGKINWNNYNLISGLTVGTAYYIRIYTSRGVPSTNQDGIAGTFKIMIRANSNLPLCVSNVSNPVNGEINVCTGNILLTWPSNGSATGFDLYLEAGNSDPAILVASNIPYSYYDVSNLLPNTTYYWKIRARKGALYAASCSNIFWFRTGDNPCYCEYSNSIQVITKVSIAGLNNSSSCSTMPGTVKYTSLPATPIHKNRNYPITIELSNCGILPEYPDASVYVKVYLDLNQDGDFTDPFEEIFNGIHHNLQTGGTGIVSGMAFIPPNTVEGLTNLRVVATFQNNPLSACNYNPGEVEEYVLDIMPPLPCTLTTEAGTITGINSLCKNNPAELKISGFTNGAELQWQYALSPEGPWINHPDGNHPTLATGPLSSNTYYRVMVTCAETVYTNPYTVNIKDFKECFCMFDPIYGYHSPDIVSVQAGPLSHQLFEGNPAIYNDYTSLGSAEYFKTVLYNFSARIASGSSGDVYAQLAVFIDLNHNSSFNDPGEMVIISNYVYTRIWGVLVTGTFTIPSTAMTGETRLRIVMHDMNTASMEGCFTGGTYGNFGGTVLDYLIDIRDCSSLPPPVISVSDVSNSFCNSIQLTANSSVPVNTFNWSTGQTTQSIDLTTANQPGSYSVNLTYVNGCNAAANYSYDPQVLTSSYTLLATTSLKMHSNNTVINGSAGVVNSTGSASIKKNTSIAGPGAFLKANNISLQTPYNIPTILYAPAPVALPVMHYNTTSTSGLANVNVTDGTTTTITGNRKNVTIGKNCNVILTGNIFANISIGEKSKILFTQSLINVNSIYLEKGNNSNLTALRFSSDAIVRSSGKITINEKSVINPENFKVIFYIGKPSSSADFTVEGDGNVTVNASMYIPNGKLSVEGDDEHYTYMNGKFIAEKIETNGKNVTWNWYECEPTGPPPPLSHKSGNQPAEQLAVSPDGNLGVKAWPNPSENEFTLRVSSSNREAISIRVTDMSGQTVWTISGMPGIPYQLGQQLARGVYIAEVTQGSRRVYVKLVRQ